MGLQDIDFAQSNHFCPSLDTILSKFRVA